MKTFDWSGFAVRLADHTTKYCKRLPLQTKSLLKYFLLSLHVDSHALIKFETEGATSVIPLSRVVHKPLNHGDH